VNIQVEGFTFELDVPEKEPIEAVILQPDNDDNDDN
jgi:hypothetical protein